jgi:hypothetical protein
MVEPGAAGSYIYDRYRESTAQSRSVNFIQEGASYNITNASTQPTHQVRLLYYHRNFLGCPSRQQQYLRREVLEPA